jgi:hypothetical protein
MSYNTEAKLVFLPANQPANPAANHVFCHFDLPKA